MKTSEDHEDPEMNPHNYTHHIFDKVPKIYDGEKTVSSTMLLGKVVICLQETKLDPSLSPCTSINSKWINNRNMRPETLKLVQKGAGDTLEVIGIGKDFLNRTPASQQLRKG
jgi:hypothetical protein